MFQFGHYCLVGLFVFTVDCRRYDVLGSIVFRPDMTFAVVVTLNVKDQSSMVRPD